MVGIIDYGVGNIASIKNALLFLNKDLKIDLVENAEDIQKYSKIILPGVGAFGNAIDLVRSKNFDDALIQEKKKGKYILGICLGMQMLADKSHENGEHKGLGLIKGEVVDFVNDKNLKIPHMGWNEVFKVNSDPIFNNIEDKSDFYFVHSYHFVCEDIENQIGVTNYGYSFASVVKNENVYGTQFHPEKSQKDGLVFLKNFIELN